MLKLRLGSNSSPTSTTALTLSQEYDEIQKANIFPTTQEDQSVTSRTSIDVSGRSGKSSRNTTASSSATSSSNDGMEDLRAQVESLRQQLAERDATVNELQRQIQEDKRAHDKLQTRWDLFFGGASSSSGGDTMTMSMSSHHPGMLSMTRQHMSTRRLNNKDDNNSNNTTTTTTNAASTAILSVTEMQRLNKHMDQLEADKEACMQKTLKLSVALAETKARVSTLESQLEEYQNIILIQNNAPLGFSRVTVKTNPSLPSTPAHSSHGYTTHNTHSTPNNNNNRPRTASASASGIPPPLDSFLPICDIQLNDSNPSLNTCDIDNNNNKNEDQQGHVTIALDDTSLVEREKQKDIFYGNDNSECLSLESESLGWLSERGYDSSQRGGSERGTSHTTSSSSNSNKNNNSSSNASGIGGLANGLRTFRNRIASTRRNSIGATTLPAVAGEH